ncbi:type II CAAX prenyl endopeptidase Rce1 family protein [Epilithonimonas zeae]|uniref:CPBP family glutamic-type intramembrane protease n=1 Tax=Epilithonimonas zeae TaxID=1416779 RepID=UPI00200ECD37|nr:CPBP family glutamic-type intramembrane protease [Epilithonimonas zeae]UQB69836.1 CPBP family intramembrane metalloprotease [Epilithonimonas zeae]
MIRLQNFFHFVTGRKTSPSTAGVRSKIVFTLWMIPVLFFVVLLSSMIQMICFRWGIVDPVRSLGIIPSYMKSMSSCQIMLEIAIVAPLFEECAFRGPLQNNVKWFMLGLVAFFYLIICRIAGLNFYEISASTSAIFIFALITMVIPKKYILTFINYLNTDFLRGILIWCSAFSFGFWHYYNFDFSQSDILSIVVTLLPFILNGFILSYVAVKNGLIWSVILHALNNIWPLILWL